MSVQKLAPGVKKLTVQTRQPRVKEEHQSLESDEEYDLSGYLIQRVVMMLIHNIVAFMVDHYDDRDGRKWRSEGRKTAYDVRKERGGTYSGLDTLHSLLMLRNVLHVRSLVECIASRMRSTHAGKPGKLRCLRS